MRKSYVLAILLIAATFANNALADCSFNGQTFAEGSRLGNLICTNGIWIASGS